MKKETRTTFQCDGCTDEMTVYAGSIPNGWREVEFENPHTDRSWFSRHYCPSCIKKIVEAAAGGK